MLQLLSKASFRGRDCPEETGIIESLVRGAPGSSTWRARWSAPISA